MGGQALAAALRVWAAAGVGWVAARVGCLAGHLNTDCGFRAQGCGEGVGLGVQLGQRGRYTALSMSLPVSRLGHSLAASWAAATRGGGEHISCGLFL